MNRRWLHVGLLALAILVVNAISRFITWQFKIVDDESQYKLDLLLIGLLAVMLMAATAWWAYRYPFSRVFFDVGAAILVGVLACLIIGPVAGGKHPFSESLGVFIAEFFVFVLVTGFFSFVAFWGMVALGKDWKSRGLRRYEERYARRTHKSVRG